LSRFHAIATAAALAAILLAGCAQVIHPPTSPTRPRPRKAALQHLKAATPCCQVWADLPFHDQLPTRPRAFTIDRFSPVASLDGTHTHFLTFVLPKFKHPYRVVFQTRPTARHLGDSSLLAPTVTALNADYKPIASHNVSLCVYINWRPSMSGAFGAVTISNPDAQYLVVTTSKKQLAETTYWAQSPTSFNNVNVPSMGGFASVASAAPVSDGSFYLPHTPDGTLYVGRMTPSYADAVDNGLCGEPQADAGLLPELRKALGHH
jgi:hypothetical protein